MNVFTCRPSCDSGVLVGLRRAPADRRPAFVAWSLPKFNTLAVVSVRVVDTLRFIARPRVSSGYLVTGRSRR